MGGSPYLGKLTPDDKKFFGELKGSKAISKDDRVKPDKAPKVERNLNIRGQKSG